MLRRRSRPPAAPSRPTAIRVLAGAPHRVEPVSADLLPSRGRNGAAAAVAAPVAVAAAVVTGSTPDPARVLRRPTVDERATRIRAMAHAAARRAAGARR